MGVCIACSLEVEDDELTEGLCVNCASETVTQLVENDEKDTTVESTKPNNNTGTSEK